MPFNDLGVLFGTLSINTIIDAVVSTFTLLYLGIHPILDILFAYLALGMLYCLGMEGSQSSASCFVVAVCDGDTSPGSGI